ncbi:MAG TPA: 16S rRNA (adenine(1518)-N(6)/adenine(1519)-N(6))-dimethyltransferase RsmA [Thermoanaerobaculia bacterium]
MIPARKRWGQHFLVRGDIAVRIVEAARLRPQETVVEVGPGDGALTRPLAERAAHVLAIEIDPARAAALSQEFAGSRVHIARGDVLTQTFGEWLTDAGFSGPAVLVSNLPYNAATPILIAAIEEPHAIGRIVATVQREVARRLSAKPGDEDYGYLSVRVAARATARVLFDLPPAAFRPRPKVVSSVVEMSPREDPPESAVRDRALTFASHAFRMRRKTLANALAPFGERRVWEAALALRGWGPRTRGEELTLDDYLALAKSSPPS